MQLEGAVAVVTGASSGIGRATALELCRAGARVVLGGRDRAALEAAAARARQAGGEALALPGDVAHDRHLGDLCDAAERAFGPLDLFVSNAGVGHPGPVLGGETAAWREMLATNALAVFVGCREAARRMAGRGGTLVNVSSDLSRAEVPGDAVYAATKAAVSSFTASLRRELAGSGVRVLLVEPGQTATSFGRHVPPEHLRALAAQLGLDPREVPDFHGGHAPEDFLARVCRDAPQRFLAAQDVGRAIVAALADRAAPATLTLRPG
jgi:NAD(P)-dependent dehydrogenase (short-subunit alcohol dehydrogenase family)